MKVLIIGSTSVIGRSLATRLLLEQMDVKLAGRRNADITLDLSAWADRPSAEEDFDVVVHTAADFGGACDEDFIRTELVNSVGTLSACSLASRVNAKHFVLISSIFSTYSSSDPYYGIYALSKRHSEEVAQFYCQERNIPLTVLRPSQVYDDAGNCRTHQELLYLMADKAQRAEPITLFGSNDATRNYLHIGDLSEIIKRVIQTRQTGIYACANPQSTRLSEMASAAYRAFGTQDRGTVVYLREKADLLDLPRCTEFELYSKIGYRPQIAIADGYARIKDYRERWS
ncbi:NAD-dependent epimerase/dehydratase family protein [Pseudomonas fluorescens]|uniref:NAD-dependent epimerase/dehydratase family protein n=1 Tax=Pseudomonas fluorescens TaxID=294 RepID=UPI003747A05F